MPGARVDHITGGIHRISLWDRAAGLTFNQFPLFVRETGRPGPAGRSGARLGPADPARERVDTLGGEQRGEPHRQQRHR